MTLWKPKKDGEFPLVSIPSQEHPVTSLRLIKSCWVKSDSFYHSLSYDVYQKNGLLKVVPTSPNIAQKELWKRHVLGKINTKPCTNDASNTILSKFQLVNDFIQGAEKELSVCKSISPSAVTAPCEKSVEAGPPISGSSRWVPHPRFRRRNVVEKQHDTANEVRLGSAKPSFRVNKLKEYLIKCSFRDIILDISGPYIWDTLLRLRHWKHSGSPWSETFDLKKPSFCWKSTKYKKNLGDPNIIKHWYLSVYVVPLEITWNNIHTQID